MYKSQSIRRRYETRGRLRSLVAPVFGENHTVQTLLDLLEAGAGFAYDAETSTARYVARRGEKPIRLTVTGLTKDEATATDVECDFGTIRTASEFREIVNRVRTSRA